MTQGLTDELVAGMRVRGEMRSLGSELAREELARLAAAGGWSCGGEMQLMIEHLEAIARDRVDRNAGSSAPDELCHSPRRLSRSPRKLFFQTKLWHHFSGFVSRGKRREISDR